jgi:hypothetical protein
MTQTATRVSQRDALAVIGAILRTYHAYVCPGHESKIRPGKNVSCGGMCAYHVARKTPEAKTYAEMDATPTLCDSDHEQLPKGCWSIFWEGSNAPEYWVDSDNLRQEVAKVTEGRVSIEPINNCILGIFPA